MSKSNVYRVYTDDGRIICPECNTITYPDNYSYKFIDIDDYYVFSIIIRCLRCGSLLEVY